MQRAQIVSSFDILLCPFTRLVSKHKFPRLLDFRGIELRDQVDQANLDCKVEVVKDIEKFLAVFICNSFASIYVFRKSISNKAK